MKPLAAALRRWELVVLIAILLLAAALRMGAPGITEFKRDEANLSQLSLDLARGRTFPLTGISSSVGVPNPPISVYLFAIPYLISDSPILATWFVGLLNVLAVALTWWGTRRYYGPTAAWVAGLLYAASPWGAIYSRKIWAQDLLPPFIILTVLTGLIGFGEGKRWARWMHWPLLAFTVQIHYSAFTLIPLSIFMMALWYRQWKRRDIIIALGLVFLVILPAGVGAYRENWITQDALRSVLGRDSPHEKRFGIEAIDYAWFTLAGTNIHSLAGAQQFQHYRDSVPEADLLFQSIPLAVLLAAAWLAGRTVRQRRPADGVLVGWLALPVLAFLWQWVEVVPHYMIPLMPAAYMLCGVGFDALSQAISRPRLRNIVRGTMGTLVLVIAGLQVYGFARLLHFLDTHDTPGGFGTPLHYLLDVREAILEQNPANVMVVGEGELAPEFQEPAVWGMLLDRVPEVRFVDGTRTAVIPAGDSLELLAYIPDPDDPDAPDLPDFRIYPAPVCLDHDSERQVFALRPGSEGCYLLRSAPAGEWGAAWVDLAPVHFANGAILTGYAVEDGGVLLRWHLNRLEFPQDYQVSLKVFGNDGQFSQLDRPSWPGRYWRDGDTLYLWFEMALPSEVALLDVGMYTLTGDQVSDIIEVVTVEGAYLSQRAEIRLAG